MVKTKIIKDGDTISVEVADTGRGMSGDEVKRLLSPFSRGDENDQHGGAGLGLSIAARYIELMGAKLNVISQVKVGSKFRFSVHLPESEVANAKDMAQETGEVVALSDSTSVHALVIDSSDNNRLLLTQILEDVDITVSSAHAFEEHWNVKVDPDANIVVFMNTSLISNQIESDIDRIRKMFSQPIKIVAVSARSFQHTPVQFMDIGFDAYIVKPYLVNEIYTCIEELFNIEFIRRSMTKDAAVDVSNVNISELTITPKIANELRKHTATGDIAKIERTLTQAAESQPELADFVAQVHYHADSFDMQKIIEILDKVTDDVTDR